MAPLGKPAIAPRLVAHMIENADVDDTPANRKIVLSTIAQAYSQACLIAAHPKRIVGRINDAPRANPGGDTDYVFKLWSNNTMNSSGGNVAQLPQGYADIPAQNGNAPTWDVYQASWGISSRDGQAMDQLIAGPSVLKMQLRLSGSDIDAAQATATSWRNQKKCEEEALGSNGAGTTWFKYLQAVHNPAV